MVALTNYFAFGIAAPIKNYMSGAVGQTQILDWSPDRNMLFV